MKLISPIPQSNAPKRKMSGVLQFHFYLHPMKNIIKESKNYSPNQLINANNSTKSSDNEKVHYTKLDNINNFLDEFYPKFKENFELTNYNNCGSTVIVYEGLEKKRI